MNHAKDLSLIIQSRIPLVVIESHEEDRVPGDAASFADVGGLRRWAAQRTVTAN